MNQESIGFEAARFLMAARTQLALRNNHVASASLDITYRCDLDCEHCYLDEKNLGRELSTASWLDVLRQLAAMGVQIVAWSGGEVFARPDFLELLDEALRLGMDNRIKTHAGNISDERAQALVERGVINVTVSIYSLNSRIHDGITRVPGSLDRSLQGIMVLQRAGIVASVVVMAMRSNFEELSVIDDYFFDLNVPVKFATNILPDMSSGTDLDSLALDEDQAAIAMEAGLRAAARRGASRAFRPQMAGEADVCVAGRTSLYINPEGEVWPCLTFPMVLGNVRDRPIAEIWNDSEERKALAAWKNAERTECTGCGASGVCGYCPGEAFRRTGSYRVAPPEFHTRARAQLRAHVAVEGISLAPGQLESVPVGLPAKPKRARFPIRVGQVDGTRQ